MKSLTNLGEDKNSGRSKGRNRGGSEGGFINRVVVARVLPSYGPLM